ncbi:FAD-dependent oxidoreductase [Streptomyces europaeiscabiei]|uniref:flavin monoamine oxidase family protein n=1 Tax=Streptomyces europaeiscabiei TaxID=146819 RepID=UPI002E19B04A
MSKHDVVVVGAGVTGLTAAWRLVRAGRDVVVLEGRGRVGGRLRTDRYGDTDFEIGGQWVSSDQEAVLSLIHELGLTTFPRYREGRTVYLSCSGDRRCFSGVRLPLPATTAEAVDRLIADLDRLAAAMDPERPWELDGAQDLDSVTFQAWLERRCDDVEARDNIALFVAQAMLTKPAYRVSALQVVHMAASTGSFTRLTDADFVLDRRVVGGLHSVATGLADRLGDRVRVSSDVSAIQWNDEGAVVEAAGERFEARQVVLAIPPTLVQRIRFRPTLPAEHRRARQHVSFGRVTKVQPLYKRPFWRHDGLSGTGFGPYELVHEVYDNTPEGAIHGMLVGFVSDRHADALDRLDTERARAVVLRSFADYFGEEALNPIGYVASDWQHEELTGGAYGTGFDVGGLTRYRDLLRRPVGPLHFGSSDIAGLGYMHVDGAVRVADSIVNSLLGR